MERKPVVIAQEELAREAAVCGEIKAWWASRGRTPRAYVDTYGCQQNEADSERIRGMLRASGYDIVDTEEGADCIVINTCARSSSASKTATATSTACSTRMSSGASRSFCKES